MVRNPSLQNVDDRAFNPYADMTKSQKSKKNSRPIVASQTAREIEVAFEFTHPTAVAVFLAGTFNGWSPIDTPMVPAGEGQWKKVLTLAPGRYEYCVVVDSEWIPDPRAQETVPNPYGGLNSVLHVVPWG